MPRRASNLQTTETAGLDSRAEVLLAALIKEHLVTGEAVGSRVLSDRFSHGFGWSPATIRNVMADLEETGFVEQPHTSAGRVPTDKGYRYYVDNMLGEARLSRTDLKAIDHLFACDRCGFVARSADGDSVARAFSALAKRRHRRVAVARRQPAQSHRVYAAAGQAHPRGARLNGEHHPQQSDPRRQDDLTQDDLDRTARYLNTEFSGKSLLSIRTEIVELMKEEKALYDRLLQNAILLCERSLEGEDTSAGRLCRRHFKHSDETGICRHRAYAGALPDV